MSSWTDQLLPASFRDVPFQVDGYEVTLGDNVVLREYPFQDLPTVFRMGEGTDDIKISAYVIGVNADGEDYIAQRRRLRAALTGEGVLVLPTVGAVRVYVNGKFTIKENTVAEGGMARFDISFVRAEPRRYPVGVANTASEAIAASEVAMDAAVDLFALEFDLSSVTGWVANAAGGGLLSSVGAVWAKVGGMANSLGALGSMGSLASLGSLGSLASLGSLGSLKSLASVGVLGSLGALSSLSGFGNGLITGYQSLSGRFTSLLNQPRALAMGIRALFATPLDLPSVLAGRFQASFSGLFVMSSVVVRRPFEVSVMPPVGAGLVMFGGGNPSAVVQDSPARRQLTRLTAASDQLFETLATAAYVRATTARDFSGSGGGSSSGASSASIAAASAVDLVSYDDAMRMRSAVNDQCIRLLMTASNAPAPNALPASAWHSAVMAMHTAGLKDVQSRARDLVRMTTYTPQAWQPVWYISHRLFGTADYADEILAMNPHITHPLLVPPGIPLRVMRHD